MESVTTAEIGHVLPEVSVTHKVEKKTGKRVGYNYIILRSLKESQKNDVIKCLYIKSLTSFGLCVIKEGTYGDSKDNHGRDIKDRLIWQKQLHEALQNKVCMPRLLGSFEENGNYYLVIECIKGKSLSALCKKHSKELRQGLLKGSKLGMQFLDYLLQIINLLDTLHKQHIVHRDATATNFMITPSGKVAVIDMELSYSLKQESPSPPFKLGTYGYMSPQQEATQTPTIQEDIFSMGAILFQVWTGISPVKITNAHVENLANKVKFFVPDKMFADIIIQCLQPDVDKRPSLQNVRKVIIDYQIDLQKKTQRLTSVCGLVTTKQILDTVQQAIGTLASPLLADERKGWFAENNRQPNGDKNKLDKAWYASFHLGGTGVLYTLTTANMVGLDIKVADRYIQKALALVEEKYINDVNKNQPGLHFGSHGIAACLAHALQHNLIKPLDKYLDWIDQLLAKEPNSLGIMSGISGQGIANILCTQVVPATQPIQERLQKYVHYLLEKQEKDGSWVRSDTTNGKKNRITRGFARGVAGVVYFLLEYALCYNNEAVLTCAHHGLQWLIKSSIRQKDSIQWLSSENKDIASWWCEGASGIALTFLKAYTIFKEPRYKEYAIGALNNHPKNVIDNNLSQCHGLSGLGEIYLEAYRILQDSEWLERADWIAQVIMQLKKQHLEHGPYWLVEHERQPIPGFMIGNSGVLHFLLHYCYPEVIGFPLLPREYISVDISKNKLANPIISQYL